MDELKPCPFCGKMPTSVRSDDKIHVYDANSRGCPMSAGWSTPEQWNTRPLEDALRAQLDIAVKALEKIKVSHNPRQDHEGAYHYASDALSEIAKKGGER